MMLAAPEFVEAERVDLLDEIEVAAELQQRIFADRVMRGEKGSEFQARHGWFSPDLLFFGIARVTSYGEGGGNAMLGTGRQRMVVAQSQVMCRGPELCALRCSAFPRTGDRLPPE
jgi:hypothetical protein